MSHFPVSHSNLSASHLGRFVAECYGLQDVQCRLIRSGINDTYAVDSASGKFVFRVYSLNWRTEKEIHEEIRLLQELHTQGISVSYALPDLGGNYLHILPAPEGERFGTLFTWAKGEKIHSLSAEAHHNVGRLMARFHEAGLGLGLDRVQYTPTVLLRDSLDKIKVFLPECEERRFLEHAQLILWETFEHIRPGDLRYGTVHLDIWFENLNVDAEQQITLFDFDFCGNGWLALDIAFHVMQIHNVERDETVCQAKRQAFLDGYESITPLTAEELRLLPALGVSLYFYYLGVQCERFENWSNVFLNETYLKRYISQLVKRYWDIHQLG